MEKKVLIIGLISLLFLSSFASAETLKIIVNSSNPVSSLSKEQLANYFLKKDSNWSDGIKVLPVNQPENSPIYSSFSKDILQKSVSAVRAYWNQNIFSGRAIPPLTKISDDEVIIHVRSNTGAIGYVSAEVKLNGVKEVNIRVNDK